LLCGAYFEINGDRATVNSAEAELAGHIIEHLQVHLGVGYESTKITEPGALADVGVLPGSRILHTPAWTATAGAYYDTPLTSNLDGFVSADYSYTGNDVSLLNGGAGSGAIGSMAVSAFSGANRRSRSICTTSPMPSPILATLAMSVTRSTAPPVR
jgi:hypothetical protein